MSNSWEQDLVSAQVEVNRCVFVMNVMSGACDLLPPETYTPKMVIEHIDEAINDLQKARMCLSPAADAEGMAGVAEWVDAC